MFLGYLVHLLVHLDFLMVKYQIKYCSLKKKVTRLLYEYNKTDNIQPGCVLGKFSVQERYKNCLILNEII